MRAHNDRCCYLVGWGGDFVGPWVVRCRVVRCWVVRCNVVRCSAVHLLEDLLGGFEGGVGGGNSAVDGGLQQDFLDFIPAEAVPEGGADVHGQLFPVPVRHHRGDGDGGAHLPGKARTGPDAAPRDAGDHVLEVLGERVLVGVGPVHVRVAEHFAPDHHAAVVNLLARGVRLHRAVALGIAHLAAPRDSLQTIKLRSSSATCAGASAGARCATPSSVAAEAVPPPAVIPVATSWANDGGATVSSAPATAWVGTLMLPSWSRTSKAARASQQKA